MNFNQFINKQNIIMTEDEHNVHDFLKHHDSKWSSNYIDHLLDGRDKISQRLITSLHRENLVKVAIIVVYLIDVILLVTELMLLPF